LIPSAMLDADCTLPVLCFATPGAADEREPEAICALPCVWSAASLPVHGVRLYNSRRRRGCGLTSAETPGCPSSPTAGFAAWRSNTV
jgi:hypothetical protein